uniref:Ribonuclease H-like domain, reverse transcriptase, RNA-dependent DNA polymerase n=1 Tax=Tanacetum cinerariifolium TaxID=118510 RepID=A0A699I982_TANCI|nr:ribonuclease H-like domain, reverse transcriptase, RNA-dependent DNA polymerase [Tanacetum cinerariifolium]
MSDLGMLRVRTSTRAMLSYQVDEEATDFALMAFTSNPSSSSSLNSKEEVTETVFDNRSSNEENNLANDRFKKGEGYHVVPPSLTGNYMPPKSDLSFAGLDDSIYKFKISEVVTSLTKDEKDAPETSTACVEKPKEDRSSAPLIQDWDTDSDNDSVFRPKHIHAKIHFVKAVFIRSGRIPVSATKPQVAASTSTAKPVNTVGPKQSVHFSKSRSTFHKSHSPIRRSFYNTKRRNSTERVKTARSNAASAVKGNKVTAVKTSAGCVWRPRVNEIDQFSKYNRWIFTCVDYGHPQQALKNKGIADSGCSRHMTGNKAYLADYQEINDEGFVAFGSSRGKITSKEFKNRDLDEFYGMKGIRREYSNAKTSQQNGVAKRKNMILIEAARTMVADSLLPITFWAEAVNTACYVLNRALVTTSHNKTPYELLNGTQDNFDAGKEVSDQHYIVFPLWYSISSTFKGSDDKAVDDKTKDDIGSKTIKEPVNNEDQAYKDELNRLMSQEKEADFNNMESFTVVSPIPTHRVHIDHPKNQILGDPKSAVQTRGMAKKSSGAYAFMEPKKVSQALNDESWVEATQEKLLQFSLQKDLFSLCIIHGIYCLSMDVKNAFLYGIIEEEVYVGQPPVFIDPQFLNKVYKVEKALYGLHQAPKAWYENVSTFLLQNRYRRETIDKTLFIKKDKGDIILMQVYVDDIIFGSTKKSLCDEFEALMHKRFQMSSIGELTFFLGMQVKQSEEGIFISQDKYVAEILKKFDFSSIKTASAPIETQKPLVKDEEAADVDVYLYRSMIRSLLYLTTSRPDIMFAYPRDSPFDLEAYSDSDYARASLDRKSTTGGCQFLGRILISWQCKKQTIVATSTTESEYIAAANCYGQVL